MELSSHVTVGVDRGFNRISSKHTSRFIKKFFFEKLIEVLDWTSNSPDLNPIENLWGIVKHRVEKRMPSNISELQEYLTEE